MKGCDCAGWGLLGSIDVNNYAEDTFNYCPICGKKLLVIPSRKNFVMMCRGNEDGSDMNEQFPVRLSNFKKWLAELDNV